eukprot:scaffold1116_cov340-Prasinococcus_capsulatus_cf.AAC.2
MLLHGTQRGTAFSACLQAVARNLGSIPHSPGGPYARSHRWLCTPTREPHAAGTPWTAARRRAPHSELCGVAARACAATCRTLCRPLAVSASCRPKAAPRAAVGALRGAGRWTGARRAPPRRQS